MAAPFWLTATPIAHRGLHDRASGVIENTISAARAAIEKGFAIECDVQLSSDGEVFVFHDDALERLTNASGDFKIFSKTEIGSLSLKGTSDHIPTLSEFLDVIAGRVPLICEIKSRFDGSIAAVQRVAEVIASYEGPIALKSFDPIMVEATAHHAPDRPRGFIGESVYDDPEWDFLSAEQKKDFATLQSLDAMKLDFLSWYIKDLDHPTPQLARGSLGLPIMSWTVRTADQRIKAQRYADQIVFEGFLP
ncbi:MAG: glycerophosphodiester phosphodiesterase [Hyphomicrobiales bacterium]|jgi:glycerophosphoryl diester phosphodiesterase|nr:glycerophosphodiester phosphodiesterase [Hyphomicrobiales bacterium]NBR11348.1 glycerophosphodiester phosphodiesterase [Alphaproteobacteria bacterium]